MGGIEERGEMRGKGRRERRKETGNGREELIGKEVVEREE